MMILREKFSQPLVAGIWALTIGYTSFVLAIASAAHAQQDDVVARVNGTPITAGELATAEFMYADRLGDIAEDAKRSLLVDLLIELRLVSDAARSKGIADSEAFRNQMAFLEQQTLSAIYTERVIQGAVGDSEIRAAYDSGIANLPQAAERRVRHILVADELRAEEIIASLRDGASFDDIARSDSLDEVSRAKGGDLGYFSAGRMVPEIEAAIADLQPGEVASTPVRSPFGFHVVRFEDERINPPPAFDAVEPQIRQSLQGGAQRELLMRLRRESSVEKLVPDVVPQQPNDGHEH